MTEEKVKMNKQVEEKVMAKEKDMEETKIAPLGVPPKPELGGKENKMEEAKQEDKKIEVSQRASNGHENLSQGDPKGPKKEKFVVKEKAVASGYSLRISCKNSMAICDVIRGKSPEWSIGRLEDVLKGKRVIPMAGREVPHQKGKGLAGARYPRNASQEMIKLLKQLEANAAVNGIENLVITLAKANIASRPHKSQGRRAKRTHISLEVMDKTKLVKKKSARSTPKVLSEGAK